MIKRHYRYLFYKMVIKPFNNVLILKHEDLLYKFLIKPWVKITQFFYLAFMYIPLRSFFNVIRIIWKGFTVLNKEDFRYGFFYVFRLIVIQVSLFLRKYFILPIYIIYYFFWNQVWKGKFSNLIIDLYSWIWFKYDWKSNLVFNRYEIHNIIDYLGEPSTYDPRPFYMQFWQKGFSSLININIETEHEENIRFAFEAFIFVLLCLVCVKPFMLIFEGLCYLLYRLIIYIADIIYYDKEDKVLYLEYLFAHLRYTIYWGIRDTLYWIFLQVVYLIVIAIPYIIIKYIFWSIKKFFYISFLLLKTIYNFKWVYRYFKVTVNSILFEAPIFLKDLLADKTVQNILYIYFTETYIYIAFYPYYIKCLAYIDWIKDSQAFFVFFITLTYSSIIDFVKIINDSIFSIYYSCKTLFDIWSFERKIKYMENRRKYASRILDKGDLTDLDENLLVKKTLIFINRTIIFLSKLVLIINLKFSKSFLGKLLFRNKNHLAEFNLELKKAEQMLKTYKKNNFVDLNIEDYFSIKNMRQKKSFMNLILSLSKWNLLIFDKHLYLFAIRNVIQFFNQKIITFRKLDYLTFNMFMNNVGIHKWKKINIKPLFHIVPTIYNHINYDKFVVLKRQQENALWGLYKKSDNLKENPRLFNIIRFLNAFSSDHLFKTYKMHEQFLSIWLNFVHILLPKIRSPYITDLFKWKKFDKYLRLNTSVYEYYLQERRRRKSSNWKIEWENTRFYRWYGKVKEFYTEIDLSEGLFNKQELYAYNLKKSIIRKERMIELQYYTEAEKLYHEFMKDKKIDNYMLILKNKLRRKLYRLKRMRYSKTHIIELWDYITAVTPVLEIRIKF